MGEASGAATRPGASPARPSTVPELREEVEGRRLALGRAAGAHPPHGRRARRRCGGASRRVEKYLGTTADRDPVHGDTGPLRAQRRAERGWSRPRRDRWASPSTRAPSRSSTRAPGPRLRHLPRTGGASWLRSSCATCSKASARPHARRRRESSRSADWRPSSCCSAPPARAQRPRRCALGSRALEQPRRPGDIQIDGHSVPWADLLPAS